MASGANRVYIQVDIGTAAAEDNIKRVNKGLEQTGDSAKKGSDKATPAIRSVGIAVEQTSKAVNDLTQAFAGLAVLRVGAAMIQAGDAIKRVQMSFEAMTGSVTDANDMMQKLQTLASHRVFAFQDIAEAAQRMKAFGFATSEIPRNIAAITNAVQLMGRGTETVELLTNALGVMREKGVAQAAQLFRQVAAQGVDVMKIIREELQKETGRIFSQEDIRNLMEKGMLAGEATAEAIIRGMEKLPQSDKMMNTITAHVTKLRDEFNRLALQIDNDLTPTVNRLLDTVMQLVKAFEDASPATRKWIEAAAVAGGAAVIGRTAYMGADKLGVFALAGRIGGGVAAGYGTGRAAMDIYREAQELAPGGAGLSRWKALQEVIGLMPAATLALEAFTAALAALVAYLGSLGFRELIEWTGFRTKPGQMFEPQQPGKTSSITGFGGRGLAGVGALDELNALPLVTRPGARQEMVGTPETALNLLEAQEKLIKAQVEESKAILARAEEQLYGGVAAVYYKLQQEIAKNREALGAANPQAEKNLLQAAQLETARLRQEARDKALEDQKNADKEMLQSRIETVKAATAYEASMAEAVVQDTAAKAADAEMRRLDIIKAGAEQERLLRRQLADEDYQYQKDKIERAAAVQQLALARLAQHATSDEQRTQIRNDQVQAAADTQRALDILAGKHRAEQSKADIDSAKQTQDAIAEIVKRSAAETTEALKQARQTEENERVASAERQVAIMRLKYVDGDAQTARDKIAEINKATAFEIQAAQYVADEKMSIAREHLEQDLMGLEIKAQGLQDRGELAAAQQLRDQEMALQRAFYAEDYAAYSELQDQKTLLALQAQKQINEEWIAEQKQVFEKFESGVGQVFDALFQKGKGFWQRIGNMAEDAGKQLLKAMVVPSVSAALMTAAGMPVHMEPKGDFGPGWFGQMAQTLSQKPVFAPPPKLQLPQLEDLSFTPERRLRVSALIEGQTGATKVHVTTDETRKIQVQHTGLPPSVAAPAGETPAITMRFGDVGEFDATAQPGYSGYSVSGGGSGGGFRGVGLGGLTLASDLGFGGGGGGAAGLGLASVLPGLMPGTPAGGFGAPNLPGMPNVPGMSLLQSISKSGGFMNWLRGGPQQYYTATSSTIADGSGTVTRLLPAQNMFSPAASALAPLAVMGGLSAIKGAYSLGQFMQNRNVSAPARGLISGAMGAFGGLLAAGGLAAMFPSLMVPLLAAGPVGWIAAAAIGATIGLIGAFKQTDTAHVRDLIKRFYGIDIPNQNILQQIVAIAQQKYGGSFSMAVASPEVQQLVNLYAASQGLGPVGPRPMYGATFRQNSEMGGLQMQPVYANGQVVASPYAGTTTTQWAMANALMQNPQTAMYIQLDPATASALFQGQVVNVLNNNPTVVGQANAQAVSGGYVRNAQLGGLLEPATVMS